MSTESGRRIGEVILRLEGISLAFGGVKALTDISFDVREHEVRAIIGPNGAGKSSMLNVINGVYHPQQGTITFRGEVRRGMRPHEAAARGVARTFQNIALFKGMSVLDNILTGRNLRMKATILEQAIYFGRARREELENRRKVEEVIDFLEIQHIRRTPVGRLPYGLQKRVELARALAAEPSMLLLDEPMAGMNVEEKEGHGAASFSTSTTSTGTTIILIEHDMGVVMDISHRIVVVDGSRREDRRGNAGRGEGRIQVGDPTLTSALRIDCWALTSDTPHMSFFVEVLVGGLLAGVMYSLVALGFVLIYKASGVFNFAQGAMVFFAALTFVSLVEQGRELLAGHRRSTLGVMVVLGISSSSGVVLRPLVNQPQITLFMATIGLTFVLEGLAQLFWGSQRARPRARNRRTSRCKWLSENDEHQRQPGSTSSAAGRRRRCSWRRWRSSSRRTRIGRALRAVADDHQAALARRHSAAADMGHRMVAWRDSSRWSPGLLWGARNGVQFALTFIALKALPVLILGGFESVPGRDRRRPDHRRLGEAGRGLSWPVRGRGASKSWFPYVLALVPSC